MIGQQNALGPGRAPQCGASRVFEKRSLAEVSTARGWINQISLQKKLAHAVLSADMNSALDVGLTCPDREPFGYPAFFSALMERTGCHEES